MPRKREATNVLLLKGKTHLSKKQIAERQEAEAAMQMPADKVRCPKWLDPIARKVWRQVVPELKALDLLTNVDVYTLAAYCNAVSQLAQAPAGKDAPRWSQVIRSIAGEFGLSTSARLKLRPPKDKPHPQTPFEKAFGERV